MLKIGWSKKDISIEGPIAITGQFHQRISKGILDPNTLTALVIDGGSDMTIMVSADVVGLQDEIIFEIRDAVRQKNPEIPAEKILMNATHTHTSPRFSRKTAYDKAPSDGIDIINPLDYRAFFVNQASDAVVEAYESRAEGSYSYGYGYAVVAHHRRPTYLDDLRLRDDAKYPPSLMVDKYARMYGKTNDPMFNEYEGNVDSSAYFLFTFDKDEKLTGAIVNVPCPSQLSEGEYVLSASYWHEFRELIKEKYGDIYILPQSSAAGDMSPRTLHCKSAMKRRFALKYGDEKIPDIIDMHEIFGRRDIACRIMSAFDEVYAWASKEKIKDAKIEHRVVNMELDAWKITEEQYKAAKEEYEFYSKQEFVNTGDKMADYKKNTGHGSVLGRYEAIINRYLNNSDYKTAEIHVVRIGDIAFASNPFELYLAFQHRIQARSPFVQTFIVQLAASTGVSGYLCTERAAENMGYSANIYSCAISPKGGATLVEETLKELQELYNK